MANNDQKLWDLARAFMPSRVFLTAVELGIFSALADGARTSAAVASQIAADPRATDRLMNALVTLGLLEKSGDLFNNAPDAQEYLVPGKPQYAGGAAMHAVNLWDTWSTLTDAVRKGTSVFKREGEAHPGWVRSFITAMHYNASAIAPAVISSIGLDDVKRVLDVGGGSGAYSIEFCRAKPGVEAVVFDLPDVEPITQEFVSQAGQSGRVSTRPGDYNINEFGNGFDLVFLSQIIHSNSPDENIELFIKAFRALNSGGKIVVQDFVINEDRTSPPQAAIFALNMLVGTRAGDTYTESEIKNWFEAASFTDAKRIDPPTTGTTLMIARKP